MPSLVTRMGLRCPNPAVALVLLAFLVLPGSPLCAADGFGASPLDQAFQSMYDLQFDDAHRALAAYKHDHPEDPMGSAANAAAYLFSEFNRLHVLELEFFTNDRSFESSRGLPADPEVKSRFFAELDQGAQLASAALARNPRDANALFASVLTLGLRGDYFSLIEKHNLQGLSYMKQGRAEAERLLGIDPGCFDAYLAIGVENYLLSLKPMPLRWVLRLGGAETDKGTGLDRLRITAERGHYLRPFARLLLAVAAMRDKDPATARRLLGELAQQFPHNPLYSKELATIRCCG
ncbi:MAG: hypothetical protein JO041_08765 [Acidobacteria bacterium]|nr:hypothetical protein [Acidobacteriota bacterium]